MLMLLLGGGDGIASENNDHGREWCALLSTTELQTTTNEPKFSLVVDVVVEVGGIGTGRNQHHNLRVRFLRFLIALANPSSNGTSIGRVAEYRMTLPILLQSILFLGEVSRAFVVVGIGTRVESEMELLIQSIEEVLRCRPQVGIR